MEPRSKRKHETRSGGPPGAGASQTGEIDALRAELTRVNSELEQTKKDHAQASLHMIV
jgi:hypothetical protein